MLLQPRAFSRAERKPVSSRTNSSYWDAVPPFASYYLASASCFSPVPKGGSWQMDLYRRPRDYQYIVAELVCRPHAPLGSNTSCNCAKLPFRGWLTDRGAFGVVRSVSLPRTEIATVHPHVARDLRMRAKIGLATPLGFEPRITPPKGAVLPLHHGVSSFGFVDFRSHSTLPRTSSRLTAETTGRSQIANRNLEVQGRREVRSRLLN
jgi:hypothetical protein